MEWFYESDVEFEDREKDYILPDEELEDSEAMTKNGEKSDTNDCTHDERDLLDIVQEVPAAPKVEDAQLLASATGKQRPAFHCDKCTLEKLQVGELFKIITTLQSEISELKLKLQSPQLDNISPGVTEELINEITERQRRASNVIIFNVKESDDDTNVINEIVNTVGGIDTTKLRFFRLGKPTQNKNRPVKILFNGELDAKNVLRNKPKILNKFRDYRIASDQTPSQRNYINELRRTLLSRQEKGETNITIKYIHGIPKIVSTDQKN
ncbi:hypothetical protein RI129_006271 [Pyrocoelia pectoralis]|uniref:Uncharacterized protein n=1 Tax=Pyrocoelia pectoralis TaxID=417401 RepID=A0AAN7VGX9_9COLE